MSAGEKFSSAAHRKWKLRCTMRWRAAWQRKGRRWFRMLTLGLATALAASAAAHQLGLDAHEQLRAEVAQQLAASAPEPSVTPSPAPTHTATPSPAAAKPTVANPAPPAATPSIAMPPTKFAWPAAGLSVDVVPADWNANQPVDPVLDANNFDPVAHWLKG